MVGLRDLRGGRVLLAVEEHPDEPREEIPELREDLPTVVLDGSGAQEQLRRRIPVTRRSGDDPGRSAAPAA